MTVVPALADDMVAGAELVPLAELTTPFELLVSLEKSGAVTYSNLQLPDVDWDTYESVGHFLGRINRSCSWWIGDWLIHGKGAFGDKFVQAATITGLSEQTLLARMFVCENVPLKRRKDTVAFSCHAAVARLEPAEQSKWLNACARGGWSYDELRARMKAARKDERPQIPGAEDPDGNVDMEMVLEVAEAILRDAQPGVNPSYYDVPTDDIVRLKAALGKE